MANEQNLRPKSTLTEEEAKKLGRNGGIASGEARRKRKQWREQMQMLMSLPLQNPKLKDQIKRLGYTDKDIDNQLAVQVSIYQEAMKGNMKAVELIMQGLGEMDAKTIRVEQVPKILDDIPDE